MARTRTILPSIASLTVLGILGTVVGCGPSFQATYDCEVRFEHCYAFDQGNGSDDAKKACWREWLHGYTYGQPSDRVEYAATRFSELSLDPTLPGLDTARPRRRSVAAPMPTSAFAPPPNVAESKTAPANPPAPVAVTAPVPVEAPPAAPRAPGEVCTSGCAERWTACRAGCKDGACEACDRTYRTCVPGCFQDNRQPAARSLR